MTYCAVNLEAIRKILKKANKQVGLLAPEQEESAPTILAILHPETDEVMV